MPSLAPTSILYRWIQSRRRLHQRATAITTTLIIIITLVRTPESLTSTCNTAPQVHEAQDSTKGTQSPIHTINIPTNRNFILTIVF